MDGSRLVTAARGTALTARSWQTEAPLRMLMNNLDPENAERPDDLVVYGGTGRAARNWASFDALVRTLTTLEQDETMLVQSGKPVGVLRTHEWAPRVLIANSNLVPDWATWEEFRRRRREALRRDARRHDHAHRRARRHGRRPAACRDHERWRRHLHRVRLVPHPAQARPRL